MRESPQQRANRFHEFHHGNRLGDIGLRPCGADPLLIALARIGRHRHHRHARQLCIAFQGDDKVQPANIGQVNIHDDKIRMKIPRLIEHHAPIRHRARFMAVRAQQIAKKLEVEFVVLDNKYAFRHQSPEVGGAAAITAHTEERLTMRPVEENGNAEEAETLALRALGWVLSDDRRAERLLALTGLEADQLRMRAGESAILRAVVDFLRAHEPDLVACAVALGVRPERLAGLGREMAG